MNMKTAAVGAGLMLGLLLLSPPRALADEEYDVVVIGGSSGGIGAALGAARQGAKVALVEDTPVLGGMLANGISNIDCYSYESLSGVFEEFRRAVQKHYAPLMDTDPFFKPWEKAPRSHGRPVIPGQRAALGRSLGTARCRRHLEDNGGATSKAEDLLPSLRHGSIEERQSRCWCCHGNRRGRAACVARSGDRGCDARGGHRRVGGPTVSRWARCSPLEPHAGQVFFFNDTGEFLPGSNGRQDRAVPSYGLRLCIQDFPRDAGDAHILKTPPPGYDPVKFKHASYGGQPSMPNEKSEMNVNPVGNELQEINWAWPEASRAERKRLYETYKNNALAYLYYLQHEKKLTHLGLPKDEFADHGHVPYLVFVREARRIEGETTMTEADINPFILGRGLEPPPQPASVGIGHYPIDAKPVRPKTDVTMPDKGDGDFFLVNVAAAFQVPYGAIVPKGVDGLLVPVGLSATHVAFSSVRMDPTWNVLGQAAGVAAAMSARLGINPRALPVDDLQRELVKQKVKLAFFWDLDADRADFEAIQLLAVRGVARADADRRFRPDDALTRADATVMLCRAFGLWPSVSNAHFTDVPWTHPAFREIETLFDNGALRALGIEPHWPAAGGYDAARHAGFTQKHQFGSFEPDKPVTTAELRRMISLLADRAILSSTRTAPRSATAEPPAAAEPKPLTRGAACRLIWSHLATAQVR